MAQQFFNWRNPNFWILLVIAILVKQLPILQVGFNWLESYFHELSHGLAALFTGGQIVRIQLFTNGAGLCTTMGGSQLLISFAGYAGAVAWGVLIYKIANAKTSFSKYLSYFLVALISLSCILWVRDILTLLICLSLIALFYGCVRFSHLAALPVLLKLMAICVLLNSLQSPLYLIDGQGIGDGSALSDLTFIPEIVWIVIWCALGCFSIFWLGTGKGLSLPKKLTKSAKT